MDSKMNKHGTPVSTFDHERLLLKSKRSQITIFIILAILLVVAIILIFMLYEGPLSGGGAKSSKEPAQYISQCVEGHVNDIAEILIENNGYSGEYFGIDYEYQDIPYLCYYSGNNDRCVPREPMLIEHLEKEIYDYVEPKIDECFEGMQEDLASQDIEFESDFELSVELISRRARIEIEREVNAEGAGEPRTFRSFSAVSLTPLYDLATIIKEIIAQEIEFCDSDYLNMMEANTWVDIEKDKTGNNNIIYTVIDLKTGDVWRFAIRGCILDVPN